MKWKRLDGSNREGKYGLSQADFYQLFAYGLKYQGGHGQMALIFPWSESFAWPLAPFHFGSDLVLHVLPFDLDADRLIGWDVLQIPLRKPPAVHLPAVMGVSNSGARGRHPLPQFVHGR